MAADDDWRLTGQERYLQAVPLQWATWRPYRDGWDHDHCEFCWQEFADGSVDGQDVISAGWVTDDNYRWVCDPCYQDFRERFGWLDQQPPNST